MYVNRATLVELCEAQMYKRCSVGNIISLRTAIRMK